MRRMINRSGPPRFPIPSASIFIYYSKLVGAHDLFPRIGEFFSHNKSIHGQSQEGTNGLQANALSDPPGSFIFSF
jgi:hypothetical protein